MGAGLSNSYISNPTQIPRVVVDTYTGNGAASQGITTPFQPDFVLVMCPDTGSAHLISMKTRDMAGTRSIWVVSADPTKPKSNDTSITGIATDGFTVVSGDGFNNAGIAYYYVAIKAGGYF